MDDSPKTPANSNTPPQDRPEDDPEIAALLNFEPAPRQNKRKDGWTPALQRKFIAHLAKTGSPHQAAEAVGKNRHGVEKVYKSPGSESFREAWDSAVAFYEQWEADRIEREHANAKKPPYFDRRRKRTPPLDGEGKGWGASDNHHPHHGACQHRLGDRAHAASPIEGEEFQKIPVICDKCAAEGAAGDEAFADIPHLLAFEPVPRPAHDRLWDAPTQRAFVAALAVTGSVERAARSIKRHTFAVEKLRKSRGAREFNEACEAALDVARQRELAKMGGRLSELGSGDDDGSMEAAQQAEYEAARERIRMRLMNCRRLYLWEICEDEAKRAAWELLCGPTDWEKAKRPIRGHGDSDAAGAFEVGRPNMREPSMILPVENGWLTDLGGPTPDGRDKMAELRAEVEKEEAEQKAEERRGPRIYNLNSPEAYEVLCPRDSRPWIPNGALPREKRPDRGAPVKVTALLSDGESGVHAEADNEEAAKEAFKEWQAHVDAGRIGGPSTDGKATDGEADKAS